MKIVLDIPNNKVSFAMKVLQSLSFIEKATPVSNTKLKLWEDLTEAAHQVREHKKGKLKLKSAQDLLNEL